MILVKRYRQVAEANGSCDLDFLPLSFLYLIKIGDQTRGVKIIAGYKYSLSSLRGDYARSITGLILCISPIIFAFELRALIWLMIPLIALFLSLLFRY